jgi:hypothetical protein
MVIVLLAILVPPLNAVSTALPQVIMLKRTVADVELELVILPQLIVQLVAERQPAVSVYVAVLPPVTGLVPLIAQPTQGRGGAACVFSVARIDKNKMDIILERDMPYNFFND